MSSRSPNYSFSYRATWIAMAVFMVVFCGPAKRVMELHFNKYETQQSHAKKLKTWYRDKRHSNPFVQVAKHHAPDSNGLVLFLVPHTAFLFTRSGNIPAANQLPAYGTPAQGVPLYLYHRNLRV